MRFRVDRVRRGLLGRRARRGQGGFVLAFVLGIIALTSVVVVALLGLALTSARIADQQAQLAREARASDGALEAAVDTVASRSGDPCEALAQAATLDFQGRGGSNLPVDVECLLSGPPADPDADLAGPDVEIVGLDQYDGAVAAPTISGVSGPTLVYDGIDENLSFNSDVRVNVGAAPVRDTGPGADAPAVDVAGQYRQRQLVDGTCGALATPATPSHQIVDFSSAPTCDPGLDAVDAELATGSPRLPPPTRTITCAAGTVNLAPGSYSREHIEALNDVLGNGSTCDVTVVFQPGIHVLDVFDPREAGDARFTLDISNPNADVIGGAPSGVAFPRACRTDTEGITLELSGRSAISHTGGRVALCPRRAGNAALPVIVQTDEVDSQPQLLSVSSPNFSNPDRLAGDSDYAVTTLSCPSTCPFSSFTTTWRSPGTAPLTSARLVMDERQIPIIPLQGRQAPWSYFTERVRVVLQVSVPGFATCATTAQWAGRSLGTAVAYNVLDGACATTLAGATQADLDGASIVAQFFRTGDAPAVQIEVGVKDVRLEVNRLFLNPTGVSGNTGWVSPEGSFGSGAATVTQETATNNPRTVWETFTFGAGGFQGQTYSFTVDGFDLPTGASPDAEVAGLSVRLKSPDNPFNVVTDPADGTRVRLTFESGGQQCSTDDALTQHRSHAQSNQELRYDLLLDGPCAEQIQTLGQLESGTLTLSITSGCFGESQLNGTLLRPVLKPGDPSKCRSVAVPPIDELGLVVQTDTIAERPPTSTITVDTATTGNTDPASFDVFGPVLLPRTDLDVIWRGEHHARPLIGDRLQVHGLGSSQASADASVGVICCNPLDGVGFLQASIDGVPRAQAVIKVDTTASGTLAVPRPVTVLDWKLCGRGGCAASP